MKPYYDEDGITIFLGDALDVMRSLAETVDIVVTSPPYNMGLKPGGNGRGMYAPGATGSKGSKFRDGYGAHDDAMPQDDYDEWQRECLVLMWHLAERAVFYNHRPRVEHGHLRAPLSFDFGPDLNPHLRQIIVWDRGTGIDVSLRHFCTRGEWIMLFAGDEFSLRDHSASGLGDVWRITPQSIDGHPAPFPVALPERCIVATGARSVLDPFAGSGSTLVAAKAAGIRAVGIDNNEAYCEIAADRLRSVLGFGASNLLDTGTRGER